MQTIHWTPVGELAPGDVVRAKRGRTVLVTAVEECDGGFLVAFVSDRYCHAGQSWQPVTAHAGVLPSVGAGR